MVRDYLITLAVYTILEGLEKQIQMRSLTDEDLYAITSHIPIQPKIVAENTMMAKYIIRAFNGIF